MHADLAQSLTKNAAHTISNSPLIHKFLVLGNQSTIHDHANAHCFVKVLDGGLREVR